MNKEILKHYYEEGKKFGYALARGATDLPSVQTFDELYTAQLQQHGVSGKRISCQKECGNTQPAPNGLICLNCGSSLKAVCVCGALDKNA